MSKLFISYSQKDKQKIEPIIKYISSLGHEVLIDDSFLEIGDPLRKEIQSKIQQADYTLLCLSQNAVESPWVCQEIAEVLYLELKTKTKKLLPCIFEACILPTIMTEYTRFERLYLDFTKSYEGSLQKIDTILSRPPKSILQTETFIKIDISFSGLDIYLTGDIWDWDRIESLKYHEMLSGYLLFNFDFIPGTFFRHFVHCTIEESIQSVSPYLNEKGFGNPGSGSFDKKSKKRRIWFTLPDYPAGGKHNNNYWHSESSD